MWTAQELVGRPFNKSVQYIMIMNVVYYFLQCINCVELLALSKVVSYYTDQTYFKMHNHSKHSHSVYVTFVSTAIAVNAIAIVLSALCYLKPKKKDGFLLLWTYYIGCYNVLYIITILSTPMYLRGILGIVEMSVASYMVATALVQGFHIFIWWAVAFSAKLA